MGILKIRKFKLGKRRDYDEKLMAARADVRKLRSAGDKEASIEIAGNEIWVTGKRKKKKTIMKKQRYDVFGLPIRTSKNWLGL